MQQDRQSLQHYGDRHQNQDALQQKLEQAREDGEPGESLRIERVLDMVRQIHGARAGCSSVNPPAFFVRSFSLDDSGQIDSCEPFYLLEMFPDGLASAKGRLNISFGSADDAVRQACPRCGEQVPVVGEYYYDIRPHSGPTWMMFLYLLCPHCPRLVELAERESTQSFDSRLQ